MKLSLIKYSSLFVACLFFSNLSYATNVTSCATADQDGGSYDYGDATGYGAACHDTNRWQQRGGSKVETNALKADPAVLGDTGGTPGYGSFSDDETENLGWNAETSQKTSDSGDNGAQWRVKGADGQWSEYGKTAEITEGAEVQFRFFMERSTEGNHAFDKVKAWVDLNQNNTFDEDEVIIDQDWYKDAAGNVAGNENASNTPDYNDALSTNNFANNFY